MRVLRQFGSKSLFHGLDGSGQQNAASRGTGFDHFHSVCGGEGGHLLQIGGIGSVHLLEFVRTEVAPLLRVLLALLLYGGVGSKLAQVERAA